MYRHLRHDDVHEIDELGGLLNLGWCRRSPAIRGYKSQSIWRPRPDQAHRVRKTTSAPPSPTADAALANMVTPSTPSPDRSHPPCRHDDQPHTRCNCTSSPAFSASPPIDAHRRKDADVGHGWRSGCRIADVRQWGENRCANWQFTSWRRRRSD